MDCTNCKKPIQGQNFIWNQLVVCQSCQMKLRKQAMIDSAKRQKIFFTMNPDIVALLKS